jgi:F0F1-type ATP synthase assembly protein I
MKKNKNIPWAKLFITYNLIITVILGSMLSLWNLSIAKSFLLGSSSMLLPTILHAIITFNHSQTAAPQQILKLFLLGSAIKFIFVIVFILLALKFFVINISMFFIGICFSIALYVSCSFIKINKNINYAQ